MKRKTKLPVRRAAGGVVYAFDPGGELRLLLIRDKQGRWTLPKGHLEPGESAEHAALREVREETGIEAELGPHVGNISYPLYKKGVHQKKHVSFFLMRAELHEPTPQTDEGISAAEWMPSAQALTLAGYPLIRETIERALRLLFPLERGA
jgi:ADP-ribose pyrophosphatase YjhB (NUDIX family)